MSPELLRGTEKSLRALRRVDELAHAGDACNSRVAKCRDVANRFDHDTGFVVPNRW